MVIVVLVVVAAVDRSWHYRPRRNFGLALVCALVPEPVCLKDFVQ